MGKSVIAKRLKAFAVDYLIIIVYAGILAGLVFLIPFLFSFSLTVNSPLAGELIGFSTLTLPVILYFTFFENSKAGGSYGKRIFRLKVTNANLAPAGFTALLFRNCLKFLPWELAHFFVFQLFYFDRNEAVTPRWVTAGLVIAQALAILYLIFIFIRKDGRTIYELASGTRVVNETILIQ